MYSLMSFRNNTITSRDQSSGRVVALGQVRSLTSSLTCVVALEIGHSCPTRLLR